MSKKSKPSSFTASFKDTVKRFDSLSAGKKADFSRTKAKSVSYQMSKSKTPKDS